MYVRVVGKMNETDRESKKSCNRLFHQNRSSATPQSARVAMATATPSQRRRGLSMVLCGKVKRSHPRSSEDAEMEIEMQGEEDYNNSNIRYTKNKKWRARGRTSVTDTIVSVDSSAQPQGNNHNHWPRASEASTKLTIPGELGMVPTVFQDKTANSRFHHRLWEDLEGNNFFMCNGRCMGGRLSGCIGTSLLIFIISALFIGFDLRLMLKRDMLTGIILIAITSLLLFYIFTSFFYTSMTDPGIIPRARNAEAKYSYRELCQYRRMSSSGRGEPPMPDQWTRTIRTKNMSWNLRFCSTCKMWRPPRASHCHICDNCIERMDHHCPWTGNCVGRANYRNFIQFVSLVCVYGLFAATVAITNFVLLAKELGALEALKIAPLSVTMVAPFGLVTTGLTGYLLGLHVYLMRNNLTTREYVHDVKTESNPFYLHSKSANCRNMLCDAQFPRLLQRRKKIFVNQNMDDIQVQV